MKKEYIILLVILINTSVFGQYSFNVTLGTYQDLVNPISVNNGVSWNQSSSFPIYFNFNFSILNQTYTALNIMAGGGLSFPGLGTKQLKVFSHPDSGYLLGDRDSSNSASPISYEIVGSPSQRILKIQWGNAGFREWCASSDTNDFVNFQIWLYEDINRIEVHFGDNQASSGAYGQPDCNTGTDGTQFIFMFDRCDNALSLTGPCALPSYDFRDHCWWQPGIHINGTPSSGIIYNLWLTANSLNEESQAHIQIYPNPVNENITISEIPTDFLIQDISVTDILGNICFIDSKIQNNVNKIQLSLNNLKPGIYFLKLTSKDNKSIKRRFIKNCY